jgi:hypothetical protein
MSSDCAAGTFCAADIADARGCYPDLGCDPIAQDCNNGTACVPIANGATWCVSAGAARAGEPCSDASLAALCEPGTRCNAGTCEQLCAVGGVGCAGGLGCVSLEPETGVDVGVCR